MGPYVEISLGDHLLWTSSPVMYRTLKQVEELDKTQVINNTRLPLCLAPTPIGVH